MQAKAKIARRQLTKLAKKISLGLVIKRMWSKIASTAHVRVQQSTTKLHGVAKRVQHYTTTEKTKEMYRTTFV